MGQLDLKARHRRAYRGLHKLVRAGFGFWNDVEVHGSENVPDVGGFVLAPGVHRSILDTPAVALTTPRMLRYMGAEQYFKIPGLGLFLRSVGGFPVERHATDRAAMKLAEEILAAGEPLVVFPEGTRQNTTSIGEIKPGAAYLACRQQVPIVAVGMAGIGEAMPPGARTIGRNKIVLVVGEPIYPPKRQGSVKRRSITAMSEQLKATLQELFDQAQTMAGNRVD